MLKVTFPLNVEKSDLVDESDEIWDIIEATVNDEIVLDIIDTIKDQVPEDKESDNVDIIEDRTDDRIDSDIIENDVQASLEAVTRVKRQFVTSVSTSSSGQKTGCTFEGFQNRTREVCEEIVERICTVSWHLICAKTTTLKNCESSSSTIYQINLSVCLSPLLKFLF